MEEYFEELERALFEAEDLQYDREEDRRRFRI